MLGSYCFFLSQLLSLLSELSIFIISEISNSVQSVACNCLWNRRVFYLRKLYHNPEVAVLAKLFALF